MPARHNLTLDDLDLDPGIADDLVDHGYAMDRFVVEVLDELTGDHCPRVVQWVRHLDYKLDCAS